MRWWWAFTVSRSSWVAKGGCSRWAPSPSKGLTIPSRQARNAVFQGDWTLGPKTLEWIQKWIQWSSFSQYLLSVCSSGPQGRYKMNFTVCGES